MSLLCNKVGWGYDSVLVSWNNYTNYSLRFSQITKKPNEVCFLADTPSEYYKQSFEYMNRRPSLNACKDSLPNHSTSCIASSESSSSDSEA
ncbi:hypothetical protein ACS0TY_036056 [Phlomoides rotata]